MAALLVPGALRLAWLREWRAEIAFSAARLARAGRLTPAREAQLFVRSLGAFPHAMWLRWDRWRVEMLLQDLKYALRSLAGRPGFTLVAVLTLAIGIGANAAIFGAINAVLLRPLPFHEPDRLVQVFTTSVEAPVRRGGTTSPPDFTDWRAQQTSFTDLAAFSIDAEALTGQGSAEQVPSAGVTGAFFDVLQAPALLGRTLRLDDAAVGGPEVVVLGYGLWSRRYGGDRGIVGRAISINDVPHTVVGVMPAGFAFPLEAELWVPMRFTADELQTQRGAHYLDVIGRLRPDVGAAQAQAEMAAITERLAAEYPPTNRDNRVAVFGLRDALVGDVRQAMFVLLGAVGFVLLIVCVNVASLVMTRAASRGRELAIRVAVGADRGTLVRGLLVESLALGAMGGAAGLMIAWWATRLIAGLETSAGIPLLDETRLDVTVVLFTAAVSLGAAVLFGTLPAFQAASVGEVASRIRSEGGAVAGRGGGQRVRRMLIVAETALAVVLLVGAGLLARSFGQLMAVDLGYETEGIQTFVITLPDARYPTPQQRADFVDALVTRIDALPNVERSAAIFGLPLSDFGYGITTSSLDGRRLSDDEQDRLALQIRVVTPAYFQTMGIGMARGRGFTPGDGLSSERVAILNESAAAIAWPDANALGHHLAIGSGMGQGDDRAGGTIVGVVRDHHDFGPAAPVRPTIFFPHAQVPMDFLAVTVRSKAEPSGVIEPIRAVLADLDADIPMYRVRSMSTLASAAVAQPRLYLTLLGVFAATAMLLAAIGLYGVLTHVVSQRTREIGIRMALGARRGQVIGMVVGEAGWLALGGVAAGLGLAVMASQLLAGLLFGVEPTDGATYALVAVALLAVAMAASWLPARRAARVDPIRSLRVE